MLFRSPDRGHAAAWRLRLGSHGIGGRGSGSARGSAGGSTGGAPHGEDWEPRASSLGGWRPCCSCCSWSQRPGRGTRFPGASVFRPAGGVRALAGAEGDAMPPGAPERPSGRSLKVEQLRPTASLQDLPQSRCCQGRDPSEKVARGLPPCPSLSSPSVSTPHLPGAPGFFLGSFAAAVWRPQEWAFWVGPRFPGGGGPQIE